MKVLVVEPQKPCRVQEIESLADMQQLVGGDIEAVYPFQELVAVVCNADGRLLGLPMNRPLLDKDYLPYDIIRGTFFVAGLGQEEFISLTDEQKYSRSAGQSVRIVYRDIGRVDSTM